MDYPQQLDLPFDKGEIYDRNYQRELRQSIDRLVFSAKDAFKNSEILLSLAEEVLESAKRNYDNIYMSIKREI
ncbi:hypothetical protein CXX78_00855 [Candidatus Parvarchaeota archaeon]|nr:MAG: hypothetical protein CXX78_00855 [Candidatus Parvarchaeota archaeon]